MVYGNGVGAYAAWTRNLVVEREWGVLRLALGWLLGDQLPRLVRSLLRRSASRSSATTADELHFGDVVVDVAARTVTRAGEPCTLTPKAFELLLALVSRGGRVATRQELLKEVWGYGAFVLSRTVDSHIAELRRKLEPDPAHPRHIVTVWKVGYRFEAS